MKRTTEMTNPNTLDSLLKSKEQTDNALAELADSLREKLHRLEAINPPPKKRREWFPKVSKWCSVTVSAKQKSMERLLIPALCIGILCVGITAGVLISTRIMDPVRPQVDVIRPVTETLEEFAARESEALTADERRILIAVTEKILTDHFTTPAAMREAFRYERLRTGIDSDAFNIFSDKWATKVEARQYEDSVETMRSIYGALLRGIQAQAYSALKKESEDRSQESEETVTEVGQELGEESNSELLTPDSLLLTPSSVQRTGLLRRR